MEKGRIERTKNGIVVISSTGKKVFFNEKFEMIKNEEFPPHWSQYFFLMGDDEKEVVSNWYNKVKPRNEFQKSFLEIIAKALDEVNYSYQIATIEPSISKVGKLYYWMRASVFAHASYFEWKRLASEFAPEYNSRLATLYELYLWYAYRIASGAWDISQICEDSTGLGNYRNSRGSSHKLDTAGAKETGGFCDGVGNTRKIVEYDSKNYALCGGNFQEFGDQAPVAHASITQFSHIVEAESVGVVVIDEV